MKPLEDVLVIDLTRVLAGPFATMILCDMGAEVIKVEMPGVGDEARGVGPFKKDVSAYFMSINRGKKSLTLDLKKPEGREIFLRLVEKADVVVENFRPGVMDKLGLGYKELSGVNPRLVYAACSGFGQEGPYRNRPAYDMIIQGMSGIISITGHEGGPPARVGISIGDLSASLFTAIGVLAALRQREAAGLGQMVDVAMLDSLFALLENAIARYDVVGEIPVPMGARHPAIAPFEVFSSADGYVVLAVSNNGQWERFCKHVGRPDLAEDPRFSSNRGRTDNYPELEPTLRQIMKSRPSAQWIEELIPLGIPCGPLNNVEEAMNDPQILCREMVAEVFHHSVGRFRVPACPIKFSTGKLEVKEPAPDLGEHTYEILKNRVGLSEDQIRDLTRKKVV